MNSDKIVLQIEFLVTDSRCPAKEHDLEYCMENKGQFDLLY